MEGEAPPGRGWYAVAGALALAGTAAAAGLIAWAVLAILEDDGRFLAPGRLSLQVEKPGKVVIWHDHRTVFEGRTYDAPERLPAGVRIRAFEEAGGRELSVGPSLGARSESGDARRVSVAQFQAERAGPHAIVVEGPMAPRVLSAGPDRLAGFLLAIGGGIGLLLLGWGAAMALFAWVFLRREPATVAAPGAAAGSAPESLKTLAAVVYGLQLAGFLVGFTPIVGVVLNYVKRGEARGTWLESHYTWQIRTFWWSLLWCAVGMALLIVLIGFFVLAAAGVWLLYRAIRGWVELSENREIGR